MPRRPSNYQRTDSCLRLGEKAMNSTFRWLVTDRTGLGDAFDRTPTHSLGAAIGHIVLHIFGAILGGVLSGLSVLLLFALLAA